MKTIVIQLRRDRVDLLFWDARTARLVSAAAVDGSAGAIEAAWDGWVSSVIAGEVDEVVFHDGRGGMGAGGGGESWGVDRDSRIALIEVLGRRSGARKARVVDGGDAMGPAIRAARRAADRHRMGEVWCVEVEAESVGIAGVDARGVVMSAEAAAGWSAGEALIRRKAREEFEVWKGEAVGNAWARDVVVFGAEAYFRAAEVAHVLGRNRALVPDYAEAMGAVGLLGCAIVVQREEAVESSAAEIGPVREAMRRAMDAAAAAVTIEGYDLDDTECERFCELASAGEKNGEWVRCEEMAGLEGMLRRHRMARGPSGAGIEARRVGVRMRIERGAVDLPGPGESSLRRVVVPDGWHSRAHGAGGIVVERVGG